MCGNNKDSFEDIKEEDITELLNMLENDLPKSMHAYCYLKTSLDWCEKKPDFHIKFLAPYGDFSEATFLLHSNIMGMFWGTVYSSSEVGVERLVRALRETTLINWEGNFLFTCMEPGVAAGVKPTVLSLSPHAQCHTDSAYYLLAEEAAHMEPSCQEGYYIGELTEADAVTINEAWPFAFPGSIDFVRAMIKINWGLGVFQEGEEPRVLLAWGLNCNYGGLGLVQTAAPYMRQGHASNVVKAITARMGRSGQHVHLNVVEGNQASQSLFTKLGFKPLFASCWIFRTNL